MTLKSIMMKNKKILHKINCHFHFRNVLKYIQLNLLEVDDVFVCHEPMFSFGGMLIRY